MLICRNSFAEWLSSNEKMCTSPYNKTVSVLAGLIKNINVSFQSMRGSALAGRRLSKPPSQDNRLLQAVR